KKEISDESRVGRSFTIRYDIYSSASRNAFGSGCTGNNIKFCSPRIMTEVFFSDDDSKDRAVQSWVGANPSLNLPATTDGGINLDVSINAPAGAKLVGLRFSRRNPTYTGGAWINSVGYDPENSFYVYSLQ
ncbi:MAG: hypothetical protein HQK53_19205, partial [Oligoflexia bacterium]|nr:hypothetical protein [Oligoflexia bacterium]